MVGYLHSSIDIATLSTKLVPPMKRIRLPASVCATSSGSWMFPGSVPDIAIDGELLCTRPVSVSLIAIGRPPSLLHVRDEARRVMHHRDLGRATHLGARHRNRLGERVGARPAEQLGDGALVADDA